MSANGGASTWPHVPFTPHPFTRSLAFAASSKTLGGSEAVTAAATWSKPEDMATAEAPRPRDAGTRGRDAARRRRAPRAGAETPRHTPCVETRERDMASGFGAETEGKGVACRDHWWTSASAAFIPKTRLSASAR
jgi:hypothetical protein